MKSLFALALVLALPLRASAQTAVPAPRQPSPVVDEPLSVPPIVYPPDAKAQHITGVVELQISVDPTGKVENVRVLSGPQPLRQAAVDAYYQAVYPPLLRDGKAVPAVVTTGVNFKLNELTKDESLDQQFERVHADCQQLSAQHSPDALATCRSAVNLAHGFLSATAYLDARATAYNDLVLLLIAKGKYASPGSTRPNPALPEAETIANEAIDLVSWNGPHTRAVAVAYITRAEVRALANNPKGSIADCVVAEDTLGSLMETPAESERVPYYKSQLKEVLELHAVMLEQQGNRKEARLIREKEQGVGSRD